MLNTFKRGAVTGLLATAALAATGCAGNAPLALPNAGTARPSVVQRSGHSGAGHGVYALTGSPSGTYIINEYPLNDPNNDGPTCTINGGTSLFPGDIATDKKGNLWVPTIAQPSVNAIWEVVEYAPACGPQLQALDDSKTGQPADVAFDKKGTVYVANEINTDFGPGNVAVYPPGQTQPGRVLTSSLIVGYVYSLAVNAHNDVYVVCDAPKYAIQVVKFAKGQGSGSVVAVSGFTFPFGITFDKRQNMILTDYSQTQDLIYAPPYQGAPTSTIPLQAGSNPLFSKLNKKQDAIYVAGHNGISVYTYPGGTYQYTITTGIGRGGTGGEALDPAAHI